MRLISQIFEKPVTEEWQWLTDIITSDNGTEQRIELLDPPRRMLSPSWQFVTDASARKMVRDMFMYGGGLLIPAYHLATPIASAAVGANSLSFDPQRTELRDGAAAIVFDRVTEAFEQVTIAVVSADHATLAAPLAAAWGPRASIAPLWAMYGPDNATISRGRMHDNLFVTMSVNSLDFVDPFLNPFNDIELATFGGLPLVQQVPIGDSFDSSFATGASIIDYGAAREIRNRWKHAQEAFTRAFLVQRLFNRPAWYEWLAFADYCKGSCNPFYMPTRRPDFEIVGTIAGTTMTLKGLDYANDWFPFEAFKSFAIYSSADVHYATVTAVASVGGNSVCTIDPALPGGEGYAINQVASLLLKCRIADDKISLEHDAVQTKVSIAFRTVDE